MSDHEQFVTSEFVDPIHQRVIDLLDMNDIPWATEKMRRFGIQIADWRVRFSGLFEASQDSPDRYRRVRMITMHKLWVKISMDVDGIVVGCKEFEFAEAVQNHGKYDEAIDGSAWEIYEVVAPILKNGFPAETKTD